MNRIPVVALLALFAGTIALIRSQAQESVKPRWRTRTTNSTSRHTPRMNRYSLSLARWRRRSGPKAGTHNLSIRLRRAISRGWCSGLRRGTWC